MKALKGQFLLASANLQDPNFVRSVVVILQHEDRGTLGLILNRPLKTMVRDICGQFSSAPCAVDGNVHHGGPCEGVLMVLHSQKQWADAEVLPGVYVSSERDTIEPLVQSAAGDSRFFVGCCEWGPGQLEKELQGHSWLIIPGDPAQVFLNGDALAEQWSRLTEWSVRAAPTNSAT